MYQTLQCKNCRNTFVWSEEQQQLFAQRGLLIPEYCPICRGMMEAEKRDTKRGSYGR